jgi:SsrA-binding protein
MAATGHAGSVRVPMAPKPPPGNKVVATNRQARRDFEILDEWECGIMLKGSEVKSLREAKVQLSDAYARIEHNELWLIGLHIAAYSLASAQGGHELERSRKLLVHHHELEEMRIRVSQEHLTLVPLSLYFKDGRAKLELGLGRGRKHYDKRQVIAERDSKRDADRAMAARRRHE